MTDWDRSTGNPPPDSGVPVFLQVGAGILLVPLLHVVIGLLLGGVTALAQSMDPTGTGPMQILGSIAMFWLFGIGLGQLPYVVPVGVALFFVRRAVALGVAIGAALTLALNGACVGLLFGTLGGTRIAG